MAGMSNGQRLAETFRIKWGRRKGESDGAEEVEWVDEDQQFNPLGNWLQDMSVEDQYSGVCVLTWSPGGEGRLLDGPDYLVPQLVPPPP